MQALRDKYSATMNLYHQALIDMKMMKLGFEKAKKAKTEEIMKLQQALSTTFEEIRAFSLLYQQVGSRFLSFLSC